MTGLIAGAALVLALGCTGWETGYATRYDAGLMHHVADTRNLPVADCMVSDDLAPLGAFVWVRGSNTGALLSCQVTDVSESIDRGRHVRAGLVELDWASARTICGEAQFAGPWRNCPVWIWRPPVE